MWIACEHPERPMDSDGGWHLFGKCRGCVIAMTAAFARGDACATPVKRALVIGVDAL